MSDVLFVAKIGSDELRIEATNRFDKPFTLDCNFEYRGSRVYLELPRSYQTVRGAKSAAARLFGGGLEWMAPAPITDDMKSAFEPCIDSKAIQCTVSDDGAVHLESETPAHLEEQRLAVMARHKDLVAKRNAINREIDENFKFFAGKAVRVKHSRGEFEAEVIRVYSDDTMSVKNLDTDKTSTRLIYELAGMLDIDLSDSK